jgi:hypothetical protein
MSVVSKLITIDQLLKKPPVAREFHAVHAVVVFHLLPVRANKSNSFHTLWMEINTTIQTYGKRLSQETIKSVQENTIPKAPDNDKKYIKI